MRLQNESRVSVGKHSAPLMATVLFAHHYEAITAAGINWQLHSASSHTLLATLAHLGGRGPVCSRKLKAISLMGTPITSILLRSRVPIPSSSARRKVLSQVSNGGLPRSPIGSNPM